MQIRAASGRKLMITIDVEAQPVRAERDHIDRLIWGKFVNDRYGIAELMTSAERHGVRLVTYLDYAERFACTASTCSTSIADPIVAATTYSCIYILNF